MASKVIVRLEDDLDGSEAAETIHFSVDGVDYEIDLSKSNADKFRNSLGDYISHGRKVGGRTRRAGTGTTSLIDNKSVRKWAEANGIEVSTRGRISQSVVDQYRRSGN
jgi:hypothetical protein